MFVNQMLIKAAGLPWPTPWIPLPHTRHSQRALLPVRAGRRTYRFVQETPLPTHIRRGRHTNTASNRRPISPLAVALQHSQPWRIQLELAPLPSRQAYRTCLPRLLRVGITEPLAMVPTLLQSTDDDIRITGTIFLLRDARHADLYRDRQLLWSECMAGTIRALRQLERGRECASEHGQRICDRARKQLH